MITDLILPKFNMDMESGVLIRWLRSEGDRVSVGDAVAEIGTDKVAMEVEATADGILFDLQYAEGDTVPVTVPIARIASDESEIARLRGGRPSEPPRTASEEERARRSTAPEVQAGQVSAPGKSPADVGSSGRFSEHRARAVTIQPPEGSPIGAPERPRATPAARRLARELGIDLASLAPMGRRVTSAQVQEFAGPRSSKGGPLPSARLGGEAERRVASAQPLIFDVSGASDRRQWPIVSLWSEVRLRGHLESLGPTSHPSRQAVWIFLVARALRDHPLLNCSLGESGLVPNQAVHVAFQVPGRAGLMTTVIREADRLTLLEIDEELRRDRPGRSEQTATLAGPGGTFTIVDLGEAEVEGFVPVLRPPQVAALGVGRPGPRVAALNGGGLRVETRAQLTLVCDARAADEAQAASFLATLRRLAMNPDVLEAGLVAAESIRSGSLVNR